MFRSFKFLSIFNLSNIQYRLFQTKSISSLLDLDPNESSSSTSTNDDKIIRVIGWVKSNRDQKEIKFIQVVKND